MIPLITPTLAVSIACASLRPGVSRNALRVNAFIREADTAFEGTISFGEQRQSLMQALFTAACEHAQPNWDGYGALPMSLDSYVMAQRFINAYPADFPLPEIGVDPDGEVSFEWYAHPRSVFSVSVSPEGKLSFAGLFGAAKVRGSEPFFDAVPRLILDSVLRVGVV